MMEYLDKFLLAVIGVLGAAVGGLLIAGIKGIFSIKKNVDSMVKNGENRREENKIQFQMMKAIIKATTALSTSSKTIIEVTAKQEINGNVEKALNAISEADRELTVASDKYENFADSHICGREVVR